MRTVGFGGNPSGGHSNRSYSNDSGGRGGFQQGGRGQGGGGGGRGGRGGGRGGGGRGGEGGGNNPFMQNPSNSLSNAFSAGGGGGRGGGGGGGGRGRGGHGGHPSQSVANPFGGSSTAGQWSQGPSSTGQQTHFRQQGGQFGGNSAPRHAASASVANPFNASASSSAMASASNPFAPSTGVSRPVGQTIARATTTATPPVNPFGSGPAMSSPAHSFPSSSSAMPGGTFAVGNASFPSAAHHHPFTSGGGPASTLSQSTFAMGSARPGMNPSALNPFGGGAAGGGTHAAPRFSTNPAGATLSSEARSALKTLDLKAMIGGASASASAADSSMPDEKDDEIAVTNATDLRLSGADTTPSIPEVHLTSSSTAEVKAFQDWLAKHGLQHAVDGLQAHSSPYENMKKDGSGVVLTVGRLPPCVPAL